jgi:hypothetical protein
MVPWCSGLAYVPVKDEIAGSNPVGTAFIELVSASNGAVVDTIPAWHGCNESISQLQNGRAISVAAGWTWSTSTRPPSVG